MNITFKQLRAFVAIAHSGSLTQAAVELSMTKGAISQALAEMESQLGIRLFDRMHARLLMNHEGKRLLPVADELLSRMQGIGQLFSTQSGESLLLLGCTRTIGSLLMPDMLDKFERRYGWLPQLLMDNTTEIVKQLNNFELDVALLEGPVTGPHLFCHPWSDDEMIVVAGINHPLASEPQVSLTRLNQERWVLRESGSSSRAFFDNQLALQLDSPQVVLSLNTFDAILSCVSNNLGLTFISRRVLSQRFYAGHFVQLHLERRFFRKLTLCHHSHKFISPSLQNWIDFSVDWIQANP